MAQVGSIRGLSQYIKKIRAASTQEEREAIVQKELAKIRGKYSSNKKCSAYDRKKYTWKLLYSHMMGYDVDFGHKQAADLIPSNNYDEKQVGYQALTILLNEEDEFMMLPVNNVLKDLTSRNELFVSLSLCFAGSVAGAEMSAAIAQPVVEAVMSQHLSEGCRKKAALCLLRVYRKLPEESAIITADVWCERFQHLLTTARGTGMHLAVTALLLGVLEREGPAGYEALQPTLVNNLAAVLTGHGQFGECLYYGIPSPWLQCKYLRALSYFPNKSHTSTYERLMASLSHILEQTVPAGKSNQNPAYARASVLTEAAAVCLQVEATPLLKVCLAKMTGLVERKDPNARYVALSSLCSLCASPDMVAALKPHLPQVVACLSDADPAVKKRAIDVLVAACDRSSVENVVSQLVRQLPLADADVRGELVVRVAILAERYAPSVEWYVTTMLALMDLGADEVSDDVWQRAVHAVAGSTHDRSATTAAIARSLEDGSLSVPLINTAGYVLAEYADQVPDRTPAHLAEELATRLPHMPVATQGLLLTALIKLRMHAPEDRGLERLVTDTFQEYAANANPDIQQRAVEYLELSYMADNPVVREAVFAPMPEWAEQRPLFPGIPGQDSAPDVASAEVSAAAVAPVPGSPTGAVVSDAGSVAAKADVGADASPPVPAPRGDAAASAEPSGVSVGETELVPTPESVRRNGAGAAVPRAAADGAAAAAGSPAAADDLLALDSIADPATLATPAAADSPTPSPHQQGTPAGFLDAVTAADPLAVLSQSPTTYTNGTLSPADAASAPTAAAAAPGISFDPGVLSTTSSRVQSASGTGEAQLSTFNPSAPPAAPPAPPVPLDVPSAGMLTAPPPSASPDKERILYLGKGVLLEDSSLQLGFVAAPPERNGSRTITLFAGNKREEGPLSEFSVSVAPSATVPSAALAAVPSALQPQEQLQLQLIVRGAASGEVPAPAPGGPAEAVLTLAYTAPHTGRALYRVELPVSTGSFAVPAESVSQASFFTVWGRLSGENAGGNIASGMARLPAPVPSGDVLAARMARLGFSDGGSRLDPTSPLNYAGQAVLAGGVAALTRVEVNPVDTSHINVTAVSDRGAAVSEDVRQWIVGGLTFFAVGTV